MSFRNLVTCLPLVFPAAASQCEDYSGYEEALETLVLEVESNQASSDGYWLELFNVFNEWEKVMLIFGYADPGDQAACERIIRFARTGSPGEVFRCNPVN